MNSKWLFKKNHHKAIEDTCKKIRDTTKTKQEKKIEYWWIFKKMKTKFEDLVKHL
jgi:CDP-glycerol glycerophosphotransferase (TagB/SpsB family)